MKILVLGIRGIPGVQGGIETHAEQLYTRLSSMGSDIEIIVRPRFVPRQLRAVGNVRLRRIWAPRRPGFEALIHSFLGVMYAGFVRPDILHVHAVGPALVVPLARSMGLSVVVTHHGPDYERDKWDVFARWVLRGGERAGMRYANACIAITENIAATIAEKYGREAIVIPNGVVVTPPQASTEALRPYGLSPRNYILHVGRMVPEKRQLDLIEAFAGLGKPDWQLALVGQLDGSAYAQDVATAASRHGVVLTGPLYGVALQQLYSHAGGFVLPSSHEGLPIALLEALSYGLPVIASDIPANRAVGLPAERYFAVGDTDAMRNGIRGMFERFPEPGEREAQISTIRTRYDWNRIAEQTLLVYGRVRGSRSR